MTQDEFNLTCHRLQSIDHELRGLGASGEYCLSYFQSGGGICERIIGKQCVKHRSCAPPLPEGVMCSVEYGQAAGLLRQQVQAVEAERLRYRREWESLKEEQAGLRFLADSAARQVALSLAFFVRVCPRADPLGCRRRSRSGRCSSAIA
jgi:hypothetical protein